MHPFIQALFTLPKKAPIRLLLLWVHLLFQVWKAFSENDHLNKWTMRLANNKSVEKLFPHRLLSLLLIFIVFLPVHTAQPCNTNDSNTFHPEYFETILNRSDPLSDNVDKSNINLLINDCGRFPHAGKRGSPEKYDRFCRTLLY